MGLFNFGKPRTDGQTFDGQGTERTGFIDNVFVNLEKGCLLQRYPYDNLSTCAKVTVQEGQQMVFMSEGMYSDLFLPGSHTLTTNNVPFLEKIMNIPFGGNSAFKTTLFTVSTKRQRFAGEDAGWGVGLTVRDFPSLFQYQSLDPDDTLTYSATRTSDFDEFYNSLVKMHTAYVKS